MYIKGAAILKEFFKGTGFKILIAIILIMLGLILFTASVDVPVLTSALSFITTPIQKISTNITNAAGYITDRKSVEELQGQVESLEKEVKELRELTIDYYDIKHENAQLVKHFDLKQKDTSLKIVPSSIIGRDPNENFYSFTIDEGSISGISVNDPVITDKGLVGWVYSVSANSCKVKSILSPETNVGVVDIRTGDSGVIKGSVQLADSNLARLTYISAQNDLKEGDMLVTSGLSGMYPKDLQVGKIKELAYDSFDASLYAVVEPFEDIINMKEVFVITWFEGKGDIVTGSAKDQVELQPDQSNTEESSSEGS